MRLLTLRVAMLSHLAFTASMSKRVACVGFVAALAAGPLWAKEDPGDKTILNHMTFWRQHYTLDGPVMRKGEDLEKIKLISAGKEVAKWLGFETVLPPLGWQRTEFDDSGWLRKPVCEPKSPWMKLLCLRGRFRVDNPQKATGLALSLRYRGGMAVYLNGKEIARAIFSPARRPRTWPRTTRRPTSWNSASGRQSHSPRTNSERASTSWPSKSTAAHNASRR